MNGLEQKTLHILKRVFLSYLIFSLVMGKLLFNLLILLVYLQIYLIIIISNYLQVSVDNFLLYNTKFGIIIIIVSFKTSLSSKHLGRTSFVEVNSAIICIIQE